MSRHRNNEPSQRQLRIGEEIRHAMAQILSRGELRDPALQGAVVTVIEVSVSPDLKNAKAYITPLGGGLGEEPVKGGQAFDHKSFLKAMSRAAPYFRYELARLINLRFIPKISFELDTSFDQARQIDDLFRTPAVARDLGVRKEEGAQTVTQGPQSQDLEAQDLESQALDARDFKNGA